MTDVEHPEDEQRSEEEAADAIEEPVAPDEPAAETEPEAEAPAPAEPEAPVAPAAEPEAPAPAAEEPATATEEPATPTEEPVVAEEPVAAEGPPATEAPADEPVTAGEPEAPVSAGAPSEAAADEPATPAAADEPATPAAAEEPAAPATPDEPAAPATPAAPTADATDEEDLEEVDLTPREKPEIPGADLIPDIVPEGEEFFDAEAQAAAEAEAEAAAARAAEGEDDAQPIADAAIDLAAGARYTATGKRKTSVARVILKPGSGTYSINSKPLESFFPRETLQRMIRQPLETVGYESRMDVVATMHGGGVSSQAGALRHGISRALIVADPNLRGELKRRGFLTRDPRVKERKKAGLKKARKRPQFSKR